MGLQCSIPPLLTHSFSVSFSLQMSTARTPSAKEGRAVGVADKTLTDESPYTVVDCESSITALEMVQVPLDKQGSHRRVGREGRGERGEGRERYV